MSGPRRKPSTSPTATSEPTAEQRPAQPKSGTRWLWSLLTGLIILALAALIPLSGDAATLHTWTLIVMFAALAQSWNFLGGFTGYASFGNVFFFGVGAYSTGLLVLAGRPFWLGLAAGAGIAGLLAFLLGLPVLRLRGHYFAIATLGIAEATRELVAIRNLGGSGGEVELPLPALSDTAFYFLFWLLALACFLLAAYLARSKPGYALIAIRESEETAEAMGIPTYWYKIGAFVLSAVPTALAGGLYAYWSTGFDPPTVFDVGISVEMVLLTVLGGAGTLLGPLISAILFELLSFQFQISGSAFHNSLLGLTIAIVTIFIPQGLVGLVQEFFRPLAPGVSRRQLLVEGVRRVRRVIAANGV
ncbi:branched-chain amino acid ABC transporter permease [Thermogemmatispora carboxidivorans]|uniref:branched-chain amino acid ABC transporter permease n=1 Tax=Thermogemmatispora carboxidivorans TaxID=1382306 RepID=UPI0006995DCF|nr:branched-chain amino acid ABC transporter permease [Thermogemmatispora carboxidivorans]